MASKNAENALAMFQGGNNCAQAVLLAYADQVGLSAENAKKITACFGGGMCTGGVCGAISAAMMVLGMENFDPKAEVATEKVKTRKIGMDFMKNMAEMFGSTDCTHIFSQGGRTNCVKVIEAVCEKIDN